VGYNEGGLLTEAIKNKKHAVLLIDEIEKATEEIFNIFLQVLDEGFLTDNTGVKVDFKNVILVLTSNVGAKQAATEKAIGFVTDDSANKRDIIEKELKNKFPPEFLNRLDEIVYFNTLTDDNLMEIVKLELRRLKEKMKEIGNELEIDGNVSDYIFKKILPEKEYGARPIGRAIQKEIENAITDYILENECEGKRLVVSIKNDKVEVSE
jgi:ATP-dependent Clp protease ATP-binding subunit ClpC